MWLASEGSAKCLWTNWLDEWGRIQRRIQVSGGQDGSISIHQENSSGSSLNFTSLQQAMRKQGQTGLLVGILGPFPAGCP